jgi:hypothetical protein
MAALLLDAFPPEGVAPAHQGGSPHRTAPQIGGFSARQSDAALATVLVSAQCFGCQKFLFAIQDYQHASAAAAAPQLPSELCWLSLLQAFSPFFFLFFWGGV